MTKPDQITMLIPDAEVQDFLDEVAEEGKFKVVSKTLNGATWTVVLKRKVPFPARFPVAGLRRQRLSG
jgi:hypothetical protein